AIAAVGIEWDTPHGETPADLVDAIVNHTRPALAKATEQRDRYRAAWRSARRRARQLRDDRDGTVWVHPHRQGGTACVGGTRVPVDNVVSLIADGVPPEEIADGYPSVTPAGARAAEAFARSEEHTSELQSREKLVCRLLLEKKKEETPYTRPTEIDPP